jgi:rhodanese-related sulfurtransferase/catechol 2,3-dioxygenase-like lactoylglutathione lyase family enzyme
MSITPVFCLVDDLKRSLDYLSVDALADEIAMRDVLLLVDIREILETFDLGTIPGAIHAPRGMLEFWADPSSPYYRDYFTEGRRIVVFCAAGGRSALAAKALLDMGYDDVAHLEDGFAGWKKSGREVQDVAASSRWMRKPKDERPALAVGHVRMVVRDLDAGRAFFTALGLRDVEADATIAILELRGGTHLLLFAATKEMPASAQAPFDLMVDDLDATHAALIGAGLEPGPIERGRFHDHFAISMPGGGKLTVNSSHVVGPV